MQISSSQPSAIVHCRIGLAELFWIFLRIASTSFGGFMAMVSVVQNVVVERRKLLQDEDVLDGLSLASVLPGPTAVNVVAYVGYRLRGAAGAAVCVCAAVLPAFLLMLLLSAAYLRWGQIPAVGKAFMGIVPAVAAIIAAAGWHMCRTSIPGMREGVLAIVAAAVIFVLSGILATLAVMALAALAGRLWFGERIPEKPDFRRVRPDAASHPVLQVNARLLALAALPVLVTPLPDIESGALLNLGGAFAGMSMLMFGGGYVFIPLFQQTVVDGYGWVTQQEFVDALALGQLTPGPVMISATFIGYKVAGLGGAVTATAGMFAPSAALAVLCARLLSHAKASRNVQAALRGLRAAATGMVFAAAILVGKTASPHWLSIALFGVSLIALMRYRIEAAWVVPAAAAAGLFLY